MRKKKNLLSSLKGIFKELFTSYLTTEAVSSIFLLFSAGLAFYMANSQWHTLYETIIHYPLSLNIGDYILKTNAHFIINEGLMSLFFFVVGMEVKREFVEGELASTKKAMLPVMAAVGGSVVPALIFYYFNQGLPTEKGWGIAMATDIAFAVGIMSLLSHRVPFTLKIFLLSVAIIDDIIAVLVIALFYSQNISGPFLALIFVICFALFLYFKFHLNNNFLLIFLAIALWVGLQNSGIHATLSGVLLGFMIPYKNRWTEKQVLDNLTKIFSKKEETPLKELNRLKAMVHDTKPILRRLIPLYHPYVSYIIMPLFAFANAGISLKGVDILAWGKEPLSYGIILGLCLGKPVGITLFSYLTCKLKLSERPQNISWMQILTVGFLAGIGFTMSLFIINLCFVPYSSAHSISRMSVVIASLASAIIGLILLGFGKTIPLSQRKKVH